MLKKKEWKELIEEVGRKIDKREQMIESKIADLQEQGNSIQAKIKDNSGRMIEFEMEGDTAGVEVIKKENKELRNELEEIQDSIAGYQNQLGTSREYYAKDMDKIRAAVKKAEEERLQRDKIAFARLDELQAKMDELKKQMEKTRFELQISRPVSEELTSFQYIVLIDQRAYYQLKEYERQSFIKSWLSGDDTERYFKDKEQPDHQSNVTKIEWTNPS